MLTIRWSWVAITTVVPVLLMRSSRRMMPSPVAGSRLPVGSSASRISGRLTNARAIDTRCCSPPDSWCGKRSCLPARPTRSSTAGTCWRMTCLGRPITSRANATFSKHGLVGEQLVVLEDVADVAAQVRHLAVGHLVDVPPGDPDRALLGALLAVHQPQQRATCPSRTDRRGRRTRPWRRRSWRRGAR